jgi:hypothetical protein
LAEVRDLARQHTEAAIGTLVALMRHAKTPPAARISAASILLDRAWGKPAQALEHTGPEGERLFPPPAMLSDAQLARVIALMNEITAELATTNGDESP